MGGLFNEFAVWRVQYVELLYTRHRQLEWTRTNNSLNLLLKEYIKIKDIEVHQKDYNRPSAAIPERLKQIFSCITATEIMGS